jgi:L-ascorbate metabolism protein UlaG (beta-lactamase superfamily)
MSRFYGLRYLAATALVAGLTACGQAEEPIAEAPAEPAPPPVAEAPPAPEMDSNVVATSMGDLVIHPVHHASMMLEWNGLMILVDPAPMPGGQEVPAAIEEFAALGEPSFTLVTDIHGDHLNAEVLAAVSSAAPIVVPQAIADELPADLQAMTQVMANGDMLTVEGVGIEAVPMYNITEDRLQYHEMGRGNGYILTLGDTRVYIAGDTEDIPEMRALTDIDVAFIPMNLPYTMTPEAAASAVVEFMPTIVYPYHYGMSDLDVFEMGVGDASEVRRLAWY